LAVTRGKVAQEGEGPSETTVDHRLPYGAMTSAPGQKPREIEKV